VFVRVSVFVCGEPHERVGGKERERAREWCVWVAGEESECAACGCGGKGTRKSVHARVRVLRWPGEREREGGREGGREREIVHAGARDRETVAGGECDSVWQEESQSVSGFGFRI